jgi:hypothetical protein
VRWGAVVEIAEQPLDAARDADRDQGRKDRLGSLDDDGRGETRQAKGDRQDGAGVTAHPARHRVAARAESLWRDARAGRSCGHVLLSTWRGRSRP